MKIPELLGKLIEKTDTALWFLRKKYRLSLFKSHGENIYFANNCIFTESSITLGNNIYIGPGCIFRSSYGEIEIGDHVMFGPGVHIHGGNHIIDEVGCYMDCANNKKKDGDDGKVTVGNDCWIGANAIILKNVTIGDGCVIGAGAIVSKDVPAYSIYTGIPHACKIRPRFTEEQLKTHLKNLGVKI